MDVSITTLAKETWKEYGNDQSARMGAAFAYYTFVSFFPLLLVLIALVGIALSFGFGPAEGARQYVLDTVTQNLPAARDVIAESFSDTESNRGTLGLAGLLTGLWAASNIFAQLEESLNIIFDVAPRKTSFIQKMKNRAIAAGIVVLMAVLMIGSFLFSTVLATADSFVAALPGGPAIASVFHIVLSIALTGAVFAMLFRFIPDKPVSWKAALIGGLFSAVAWQIGRELLTWWLGRDDASVTAGTVVGSVLAFLALVYYASQILMFGAQLTATYDEIVNPDLVRDYTSIDSPLRGPGRPPVLQSGKLVMPAREPRGNPPRTAPPRDVTAASRRKRGKGKR